MRVPCSHSDASAHAVYRWLHCSADACSLPAAAASACGASAPPPPRIRQQSPTPCNAVRRSERWQVVGTRLAKYEASAAPLLEHYSRHGIVHTFRGTRSDVIYLDVRRYLEGALPAAAAAAAQSGEEQ
jgi:adenylate kinase family enzyme